MARLGQTGLCFIHSGLRIQDINIDAHTDFVAKLIRLQRTLAGHKGCLQRRCLAHARLKS